METKQNYSTASLTKPVTIHRTFNQPIDKVWDAWSKSDVFKKWWGPKDFTCPKCEIDFRVGGKLLACMKNKDGKEFWSTGTYKEINPKSKFVVTDHFADEKGNIVSAESMGMPGKWPKEGGLITVNLEEKDGKTTLDIKHEGIPQEAYDDCVQGWNQSLDKIEKL